MLPLVADAVSALRSLRRAPGFTALAVALLALGIGANVAIFSVFRSIVLSPLPHPEPERLVGLTAVNTAKALAMPALSASDYRDLRARATSYDHVAAFRPDFVSYAPAGGDPVQFVAAHVTEDFLAVFRARPALGRGFLPEEFSAAAPRTALLSHAAWRRHFAGRAVVVGTTVLLNDAPTTLVGVLPPHFREPEFVDVWLPFPAEAPEYLARDSRFWWTVGRLKPGATLAAAGAEAAAVAAGLAREFPSTNRDWSIAARPLLELRIGDLRPTLLLLLGAVGLVLLVACVNLANLLLARGVARLPELAVRLALGATPGALARAVLAESLLLALAGGALGAGLAAALLPALAAQLPAGLVPRSHEIGVDPAALLFALAASAATGLLFGVLPAWQVRRAEVGETLKAGASRGATGGFAARARSALIVGQVALTLVVLSTAAVLVRGLLDLQRTDPGFDPRDVLTVRLAPPPAKWETMPELAAYYERVLDEVGRVPGVESAAVDSSAPLSGLSLRYPFWVEGRPRAEGNADDAVFNSVSPDFFRTLRVPLRAGRLLDARDDERARLVCVINESLARRLFPGESPLGKRIQTLPWMNRGYREVVGVVGDVRQENLADPPPPQIYVPLRQSPWFFATLVVRAPGPSVSAAALQGALRRADPTAATTVVPLAESIARTAAVPRLRSALFGLFGLVALGLSAFGIYASLAFTVNQRVREFGVRLALGASPGRVLAEVLARAGRLVLAGVAIGVAGAVACGRLLHGLLPGVAGADPLVLAGLAVLLPLVALAAAAQPAIRASRLNPVQALQAE